MNSFKWGFIGFSSSGLRVTTHRLDHIRSQNLHRLDRSPSGPYSDFECGPSGADSESKCGPTGADSDSKQHFGLLDLNGTLTCPSWGPNREF